MQLISLLILLLLLLPAVNALGQATVYKSVDENGVVSFSDTPPLNVEEAQRVQIDTPPPSSTDEYQQNLDAMRDTTDRMASDRRDREKHRAEIRELDARTSAWEQPQQPDAYDDYVTGYRGNYSVGEGYRPGRPPWRPGHRPQPEHPIARPPHRPGGPDLYEQPGATRATQNNSQLMRPITTRR